MKVRLLIQVHYLRPKVSRKYEEASENAFKPPATVDLQTKKPQTHFLL